MKRIDFDDGIGAVEDKHGAGKDGWTNGTPSVPSSGTIPQDYWFDNVQEELAAIVEADGTALDGGNLTQVLSKVLLRTENAPQGNRSVVGPLAVRGGSTATSEAENPAFLMNTTQLGTWRQILAVNDDTPGVYTRLYINGEQMIFTRNAYWQNGAATWTTDSGSFTPAAIMLNLSGDTISSSHPSLTFYTGLTAGAWARSSVFSRRNMSTVVGVCNSTAGSPPTLSLDLDTGVSGVSLTAGQDGVRFTFDDAFYDSDYFISASVTTSNAAYDTDIVPAITAQTTTYLEIKPSVAQTGDGLLSLGTSNVKFMVECKGRIA